MRRCNFNACKKRLSILNMHFKNYLCNNYSSSESKKIRLLIKYCGSSSPLAATTDEEDAVLADVSRTDKDSALSPKSIIL